MKLVYDFNDGKDCIRAADELAGISDEAWNVLAQLADRYSQVQIASLKPEAGGTLAESIAKAQGRAEGAALLFQDVKALGERAAAAKGRMTADAQAQATRRPALVAAPGRGSL